MKKWLISTIEKHTQVEKGNTRKMAKNPYVTAPRKEVISAFVEDSPRPYKTSKTKGSGMSSLYTSRDNKTLYSYTLN